MKLYDINRELEQLLEQLEPDPETGEVTPDYDEIIDRIGMLSMKREDILEYLAKLALDARASAQALKAEEKRLKERRERMEGRQDRLIALLDRECGGQKTDLGVATLCYRKNTRIEIGDEKQAAEWLRLTGHDDCYYVPAPVISKTGLGRLLDAGEDIPGVTRVTGTSCYLR